MTWFAINYYPFNFLATCGALAERLPSGLPGARSGPWLFKDPLRHLLDQRPFIPSSADVAAERTAEAPHAGAYCPSMHMDLDDYRSEVAYV